MPAANDPGSGSSLPHAHTSTPRPVELATTTSSRPSSSAFREALRAAGIPMNTYYHTLHNSSATELLRLGHDTGPSRNSSATKDLSTTMIYTDVLDQGALGIASPLDHLPPASPSHSAVDLPSRVLETYS